MENKAYTYVRMLFQDLFNQLSADTCNLERVIVNYHYFIGYATACKDILNGEQKKEVIHYIAAADSLFYVNLKGNYHNEETVVIDNFLQ